MNVQTPSGEHATETSAYRAALRRERLAARLAIGSAALAAASASIEGHLAALLAPLPHGVLGFCAPVRNEFDARPLAGRLLDAGWTAAMPVVVAEASPMRFRAWTPSTAMGADRYGMPIPLDTGDAVPTVILLPLVAFDAQGFRLGYGGGYFDRTLASLAPRPLAVGVGFEVARCDDVRPQGHDVRLDLTVTEAGVVRHSA